MDRYSTGGVNPKSTWLQKEKGTDPAQRAKEKDSKATCYNCSAYGHSSKNCPKGKSKGGKLPGMGKGKAKGGFQGNCHNCGVYGHLARFCLKGKGKGKGKY